MSRGQIAAEKKPSRRHQQRFNFPDVPQLVTASWSRYSDRLVYDLGLIDSRLSFDSLQRRSEITEKANRFAEEADFSQRIRE